MDIEFKVACKIIVFMLQADEVMLVFSQNLRVCCPVLGLSIV
jgi:hypothetical protein